MKFIKISDGSEYSGDFPEIVSCVHTDLGATRIEKAHKGDTNYDDILITHMFSQGYVVKKETTKGGPGSGNFGHAGRPGEVGGSASSLNRISGVSRRYRPRHENEPRRDFRSPVVKVKPIIPRAESIEKPSKKPTLADKEKYTRQMVNNYDSVIEDANKRLDEIRYDENFYDDISDMVDHFVNSVGKDVDIDNLGRISNAVKEFSDTYRDEKIEHCVTIDTKTGKPIFTKTGDNDSVNFTDEEIEGFVGRVLIHNHPMGRTFSEADIALAMYSDLHGIMCTNIRKKLKDGVFSSEKVLSFLKTNGKPSLFSKKERENFALNLRATLEKLNWMVKRKFGAMYLKAETDAQREFIDWNHVRMVNAMIAKIYGFEIDEVTL